MISGGAKRVLETEPGKIAKKLVQDDSYSIEDAKHDIRLVDEHELHNTINVFRTRPNYERAAGLSQEELNRRSGAAARRLTIISTVVSGIIGLLGVVLGVVLTQLLGS